MLNTTAEDIDVKLDKQIHPDVATAYNLAPIEFAALQFNEPRFSYFVRRMITDYVENKIARFERVLCYNMRRSVQTSESSSAACVCKYRQLKLQSGFVFQSGSDVNFLASRFPDLHDGVHRCLQNPAS